MSRLHPPDNTCHSYSFPAHLCSWKWLYYVLYTVPLPLSSECHLKLVVLFAYISALILPASCRHWLSYLKKQKITVQHSLLSPQSAAVPACKQSHSYMKMYCQVTHSAISSDGSQNWLLLGTWHVVVSVRCSTKRMTIHFERAYLPDSGIYLLGFSLNHDYFVVFVSCNASMTRQQSFQSNWW